MPVLIVERELVVRLEDQTRAINENDLRNMLASIAALPLIDVVIAEKPIVDNVHQARFGKTEKRCC